MWKQKRNKNGMKTEQTAKESLTGILLRKKCQDGTNRDFQKFRGASVARWLCWLHHGPSQGGKTTFRGANCPPCPPPQNPWLKWSIEAFLHLLITNGVFTASRWNKNFLLTPAVYVGASVSVILSIASYMARQSLSVHKHTTWSSTILRIIEGFY